MGDLIRDSALGYIVRSLSGNRFLQYDENKPGFQLPEANSETISDPRSPSDTHGFHTKETEDSTQESSLVELPIKPTGVASPIGGHKLVDWYSKDDPANPQNWSFTKKCFVAAQICIYTFSVYIGSAIYTPSISEVSETFGVSLTVASLGLSLYVLGYGTGPLLFSPLSEVPRVGRNPPYIITFGIFVILCVPTALIENLTGLLVLRFLLGFFGSPCLATGGASFGDMFDIFQLPFLMAFWTAAATAGPSLGPTIAGYSVQLHDWRWPLWEMIWIAGPVFLLLFVCLPETSSDNILLRRAERLRQLTGDNRFQSQSEIKQRDMKFRSVVKAALWRPAQIVILDPAITFVTIYTSLTYAIYYTFFESFPFVYIDLYGFSLGQIGISFLSIVIAMLIQTPIYLIYLRWQAGQLRTRGFGSQEERLIPALLGCLLPPIGLFMFAWTANGRTHWIISLIGVTLYNMGIFIVFQCIFIYIPLSYAQYTASLLGGNALARSALSAAAILFARPMFLNMGVNRGVTVLAGLTVGGVVGMFALYYYGANLRARSRFTVG